MKVKDNEIILIGRSIGTGVTVNLCTKRKPKTVILISPFKNILAIANDFVGDVSYIIADAFDNINNCTKIKCPTLIMHGIFDTLIPYTHSEILSQQIQDCTLHLSNKMEHNKISMSELTNTVLKFLLNKKL